MLDIQFIRDNAKLVKEVSKNKNVEVNVDKLLELDKKRRQLISDIEETRSWRNVHAQENIGAKGPSNPENIEKGKDLKRQVTKLESELKPIEQEFTNLLQKVPNVYSQDTPVGKDETANKVIRHWGAKPKLDFEPQAHWDIGKKLGLIDSEAAAEVAGSRFTYLKGNLVRLQFALWQWILDTLTDAETLKIIIADAKLDAPATPFIPVLPPAMAKSTVFAKTGRRDPVEDKYFLDKDDLFLIGSAEHTLAPMHMNEIFKEEELPLRYVGYSTNFRREAGSYGKDVRGILRLHQFDKWEMFSLTSATGGETEQNLIVAIQEHLMQQLQLPYQVVAISTGDMGKPDYRQIDIEAWLPSQNKYRETQTADWNTDFQARSLGISYQDHTGQKKHVHTNDATVLSQRALIAIMENYQTSAGKVRIPEVLRNYMKGVKYL